MIKVVFTSSSCVLKSFKFLLSPIFPIKEEKISFFLA
nr:MAG TPA: hypothetical protein [Caudoviricetes sp.]